MINFRKGRKTVYMVAIATALVLVFSSYTPVLSSSTVDGFTLPCTIKTYGSAWNGEIVFDLYGTTGPSYLVVMDTNGTVLDLRESTGTPGYGPAYNIAPNTLLFEGEPLEVGGAWPRWATHIWNLASNTTENFPNVISEHYIQYDPVNNTFLTLQAYVRQVGSNSILMDKIVQVNAEGNVLWTWDTYNHIPLSEASPFDETVSLPRGTVEDFSHANSLFWDYNDSVIYLNLRNQNTFYAINQTTGNIIWACGEFGNFTLLGANGQPLKGANGLPPSLWYHSHDLREVAPDIFTMFNNDYDNNTNPDDGHSSLMEVTLNETSMTAYVSWNWEAPISYYNYFGGSTVILPNGDYLGDFGDSSHQEPQNELPNGSWNFSDTGAAFAEVNPAGHVVRTWTFPVGYYVYRVEALTNVTPVVTASPSPSPFPSPSPSASSKPASPIPTSSPSSWASLILPFIIVGIVVAVIVIVALVILILERRAKVF